MNRWCLALLAIVLTFAPLMTAAQTIDVLWYSYPEPPGMVFGRTQAQYREQMQELADNAHTYPAGSGVRWNLTFFSDGETPDFSAFDVLVIQSPFTNVFLGFPKPDPSYAGILDNQQAIEAARGSRTLITGMIPDLLYIFWRVEGNKSMDELNDGERGLLVNMINWGGSGAGLGIVAFDDEDVDWMTRATSFLREDVLGWNFSITGDCCSIEFIPDFAADYPINAGLTGEFALSPSSGYDLAMPGYVAVHRTVTSFPEQFGEIIGSTMVTASEAAGATTPVADSAEFWCESLLPPLDRAMSLAPASQRMIPVRMRLLDGMGDAVTAEDLSQPPQLQLRSGATTRFVGPFSFNAGPGVWTARLDSSDLPAAGTYTVEAVAGNNSYEVDLCEQTIERR